MSLSKPYETSSGRKTPLIAIEHLEEELGKWILLEYKHSYSLAGERLVITNAGTYCEKIWSTIGRIECYAKSILELKGILYNNPEKVIILDPRASKVLEPDEAREAEVIVVGGILGDHPPRGRTWSLLTRNALPHGMKARNIGPKQFSIDGAVYVALQVINGVQVKDIAIVEGLSIEVEDSDGVVHEITLPFAYPIVEGKPLYAPGLIELLRYGLPYEEYMLTKKLKQGRGQGL